MSVLEEVCSFHRVKPRGVIHLGAHVGQEIPLYSKWGVPVAWVEANPYLIAELRKNVRGLPGHTVHHAAVWDTAALKTLYIASNGGSTSLLPMKLHRLHYPEVVIDTTVVTFTTTLDELARRDGLRPEQYDFLNMDIQGAEGQAIAGMTEHLQHLRWIYSEVNFEELYEGCRLFRDFSEILSGKGFHLVASRREEGAKGWGEALYERR